MKSWKSIKGVRLLTQILGMAAVVAGVWNGYDLGKGILLIITLIMGPLFCGWVCPFGFAQDLMSKIGRCLHIRKKILPEKIYFFLRPLRYILLGISFLYMTDLVFRFLSYDPQTNFETVLMGNTITGIGWGLIALFLLLAVFFDRPFCKSLCIQGAKLGVLGLLRPLTVVRDETTCVDCGLCNKHCPMKIDVKGHGSVRSAQCIDCMTCIAVCPKKGTLSFRLIPFRNVYKHIPATLLMAILVGAVIGFSSIENEGYGEALQQEAVASAVAENLNVGDAEGIEDGVYLGTGYGFRGEIEVEVTIESECITNIHIVSSTDDEAWLTRASSGVSQSIIDAQSVAVDVVSGATYSSNGIMDAVADALANATSKTTIFSVQASDGLERDAALNASADESILNESQDTAQSLEILASDAVNETSSSSSTTLSEQTLKDGVYTGSGYGFKGQTTVKVTISQGQIASITLVEMNDDAEWFNRAFSTVVSEIIGTQSTSVDTVSGATFSSNGIISAVKSAVTAASTSASTSNATSSSSSASNSSSTTASTTESVSDTASTGTTETNTVGDATGGLVTEESIQEAESRVGGDAAGVADGVYSGTGNGFRGTVVVNVTITSEKITAIEIVSTSDDEAWFNRAYTTVSAEILSEQTAEVDTASGATYSSQGIKQAVANALINAGSSTAEAIEATTPTNGGHSHGKH